MIDTPDFAADRASAIQWAQALLSRDDWCVLDTETTGLDNAAQICSIAILAPDGLVLLDTLVKPTIHIPAAAHKIHHITDKDVADAPSFAALMPQLQALLSGLTVIIYNAEYDMRLLRQSAAACGLTDFELSCFYECAMIPYSAYCGDWNSYWGSYRWKRLPSGDHSAAGDVRACIEVIKKMAGTLL